MKCPYCDTGVKIEFRRSHVHLNSDNPNNGSQIAYEDCPNCKKFVVLIQEGKPKEVNDEFGQTYYELERVTNEEIIYPKYSSKHIEPEVPDKYKNDYKEACAVLSASPKASAALSRRILQNILREEYNVKPSNLAKEIDEFISKSDIPSNLTGEIDAIRNIGNFAAHPLKDTNTSEIIDVESGEAEWLIDTLESLFDYTFVRPKRTEERKKKLNDKLQSLGKPPMKG